MKKTALALFGLVLSCGSPHSGDHGGIEFSPIDNVEAATFHDVYAYPQSDHLLIDAPLKNTVESHKGGRPAFARAQIERYFDGDVLQSKAAGYPVVKAKHQGQIEEAKGLQLWGLRRNVLLYSEAFGNAAWTAIGTGSVTAKPLIADPEGSNNTYEIDGLAAGDGLKQDSGINAASASFLCAVYARTTTGTGNVTIRLRDATTSEQAQVVFPATTTWKRTPTIFKAFSASASGHMFLDIEVGASSNLLATKAMCHQPDGTYRTGSAYAIGPYIKTTSAEAARSGDALTFDDAVVDNARTTGSLCLWVKSPNEQTSMLQGNASYYLSMGGEELALMQQGPTGNIFQLFINGTAVGTGGSTWLTTDFDAWTHFCATWKTSATEAYKIYKNGTLIVSSATSIGPWDAASGDLYLGSRSDLDPASTIAGLERNFALWDVVLSPSEVTSIYSGQAADFVPTLASSGKLFEVDLGTSLWPTTCSTCSYQYISDGASPYWSTATTYTVPASGVPPIGYPEGNSNHKGLQFVPTNKNWILRSEDPAHAAWVTVGTPTVTSDVGRFFGSAPDGIAYGTIAGGSGDCIKQAVTTDPSPAGDDSASWHPSAYVSTASGTLAGVIKVRATGGSPEELTQSFTATTTPTRVFIPSGKRFDDSATTAVEMEVCLAATGTLRIGGMQLESRGIDWSDFYGDQQGRGPLTYMKTTSAAVNSLENCLYYEMGGNVNPRIGTAVFWIAYNLDDTEEVDSDGQGFFGFLSDTGNFGSAGVSARVSQYYGGTVVNTPTLTWTRFIWQQIGLVWNQATGAFSIYQDGTVKASSTHADLPVPTITRLTLGCGNPNHRVDDAFKGIHAGATIWADADSTHITADWTARRASFGR